MIYWCSSSGQPPTGCGCTRTPPSRSRRATPSTSGSWSSSMAEATRRLTNQVRWKQKADQSGERKGEGWPIRWEERRRLANQVRGRRYHERILVFINGGGYQKTDQSGERKAEGYPIRWEESRRLANQVRGKEKADQLGERKGEDWPIRWEDGDTINVWILVFINGRGYQKTDLSGERLPEN